jgi:hypothetical protein
MATTDATFRRWVVRAEQQLLGVVPAEQQLLGLLLPPRSFVRLFPSIAPCFVFRWDLLGLRPAEQRQL